MLGPWLMPESTQSGRWGSSFSTASSTASVGVPDTAWWVASRLARRSGWSRVKEWPEPLRSRSGATTWTSPSPATVRSSAARPAARMPSSLVSRKRIETPELRPTLADALWVSQAAAALRWCGTCLARRVGVLGVEPGEDHGGRLLQHGGIAPRVDVAARQVDALPGRAGSGPERLAAAAWQGGIFGRAHHQDRDAAGARQAAPGF